METQEEKQIVSYEQAKSEFDTWVYDVRRVRRSAISEKNPDSIELYNNCIQHIQDGFLKINEDGTVVQKLSFPIGEDVGNDNPITEFVFKTRLKVSAFDQSRKYKNADEITQSKIAISNLTGQSMAFINKMEMSDLNTSSDLMYFYFL